MLTPLTLRLTGLALTALLAATPLVPSASAGVDSPCTVDYEPYFVYVLGLPVPLVQTGHTCKQIVHWRPVQEPQLLGGWDDVSSPP